MTAYVTYACLRIDTDVSIRNTIPIGDCQRPTIQDPPMKKMKQDRREETEHNLIKDTQLEHAYNSNHLKFLH